jgi:hypothetical protein
MGRTRNLLLYPKPGTAVPAQEYTPEQWVQIMALAEVCPPSRTHINKVFIRDQYAHSLRLPEADSYHVWEKRWLESPGTIARYMRAAKWKTEDAQKRIKATLEWRREYKPDLIPPEDVRVESETGKMYVPFQINIMLIAGMFN